MKNREQIDKKIIDPWLYQLDEALHTKAVEKSWCEKVFIDRDKEFGIPFTFTPAHNTSKNK
jgi:hypothetical protein